MVVSEIMERLSPNMAPPTTAPRHSPMDTPIFSVSPTAIGASATIVPTDVPMEMEMKQATTNSPQTSRFGGTNASAILTAESTAPIAFAVYANDPARMKIRHIVMMSTFPIP